jgi:23S rRNA maturation mini-RNase III|tara:strand:- start:39 stop:527 length:489 start_codon:yes stop_codon:yes gene_type:complete
MSQREITFNRQVFNKSKFNDTVDTEFSQLVQTPDETFFDVNLATVGDFFTIYENLFFNIPRLGEANSHEFLVKQSTEYIGFEEQNQTIQALLDEITELREENLEIRKQNLNLVEQFSTGIVSTEQQEVATGASIAGVTTTSAIVSVGAIQGGGSSGGGGGGY